MLQLFHSLMGENYRGSSSANLFVHFMGGGLAGVTSASATYPLDLVRTRLAAQVISNFCSWKLLGTLFMPSVVCMNEFALFYVVVVVWLNQIHSSFNVGLRLLFYVSLQRSTIYYRGISHAFSTICRDEGFLGLYKGLGATLLVWSWKIFPSFFYFSTLILLCFYDWNTFSGLFLLDPFWWSLI